MNLRMPLLLLAVLLSAGCVTFEQAPVATLRCDPALTGEWLPAKGDSVTRPARVAPDCALQWPEENGGTYTTTLRGFELGGSRYLVFSPVEADRLINMGGDLVKQAPKDSVLLARYRIEGDTMQVWLADANEALHIGKDNKDGKVSVRQIDDKFAHVEGGRKDIAALLRQRGDTLFDIDDVDGAAGFKRVPKETAP